MRILGDAQQIIKMTQAYVGDAGVLDAVAKRLDAVAKRALFDWMQSSLSVPFIVSSMVPKNSEFIL